MLYNGHTSAVATFSAPNPKGGRYRQLRLYIELNNMP